MPLGPPWIAAFGGGRRGLLGCEAVMGFAWVGCSCCLLGFAVDLMGGGAGWVSFRLTKTKI